MAEQQQKLKKKADKGNPLSRQPSLVRKCTDLTDIYCNNADRSMYCVKSFSRGLLKSNEECLEHFTDTVTSNLEFIPAAFKILTTIKCTGANKIRFNFILSEITRKIMDTLNLNVQVMHPEIGNKLKAKEIKNEDCIEVIEILDDVDVKDITIDSLKEINEWQDTAGDQVSLARFRSNIVADKFFASVRKDLPSIDSGCDTVNTLDSNQVDGVASIDRENLQINQAVGEKSTDKNSLIDRRDNTETLILSGIPSCQIKSEIVNSSETPDSQEVISNSTKMNIFTSVKARQFPEDPTSEEVISNSEESLSISFGLKKKSQSSRKMPHLKPIIEINPDKPPDSVLKLAGSDEIKLNSAAKGSLGSDKIKIHSVSTLNVNQTLKRKIQYPYKAKKKPNVDENESPHINIKVNSNKNKHMIVKEKLNSTCKANVGSAEETSPKSVICDSRKKSKSFRKMPRLEPIIEISSDKTTNTDLKSAPKGNPGSDEIKSNLAAKESLGLEKLKIHSVSKNLNQTLKRKIHYPYKAKNKASLTKKASPTSVINKNLQPSSEGQQPDYMVKLKPFPEENNPKSRKRAEMQSTSKASNKSAYLELTEMKSFPKTAIRSVVNKNLQQSTEEDPQLDYMANSRPLSVRINLESSKGAKAAMKSVANKKLKPSTEEDPFPDYIANSKPLSERSKETNKVAKMQSTPKAADKSAKLDSTKKKSVPKTDMNLVINNNLKSSTEESRQSDDRANSKPLSKRNSLESNKKAKMQSTTGAVDNSANVESTKKKSVSKAAMNLVGDKNLEQSSEGSRQSDGEANLESHSEGNDIELIQNTNIQYFCEAVMKSIKNKNLGYLTTDDHQLDYEGNLKQVLERNTQPHFNVYIVPFDRPGSTKAKLNSYADEAWGSHNKEDQGLRPEITTKTNLSSGRKESLGRNAGTVRESETKTCENNESLMEEEHEDLSRQTNFMKTLMRHAASNDFDYDRNLLVLSRVSPYRETIRKPRVRRRGRGRGRGKSVTSRSEVKGEENAVTERCRGGSISKPLGRQRGGGRGEVRGKLKA